MTFRRVPVTHWDSPFWSVSRVAILLVAFVATSVAMWRCFEVIAPYCGEGSPFAMIALLFLTWVVLTALVNLAILRLRIFLRVLSAVATFVFVLWLFHWETEILVDRLYANPPPRPMFCNHFVRDERVLLPYWREDSTVTDSRGNWMCADHEDNLLAIVINGSPDGTTWTRRVSANELQVQVMNGSSERWVSVRRTRNSLVVVRPDGAVATFPLRATDAKAFHEERRFKRHEDLLRDVKVLIDADSCDQLNSFVTQTELESPDTIPKR